MYKLIITMAAFVVTTCVIVMPYIILLTVFSPGECKCVNQNTMHCVKNNNNYYKKKCDDINTLAIINNKLIYVHYLNLKIFLPVCFASGVIVSVTTIALLQIIKPSNAINCLRNTLYVEEMIDV